MNMLKAYIISAAAVAAALLAVCGISCFCGSEPAVPEICAIQYAEEFDLAKININTASAEELMLLDGIGEKTAADIITYREEHGAFENVGQLTDIKGIGEKKLEKWREYLCVDTVSQ